MALWRVAAIGQVAHTVVRRHREIQAMLVLRRISNYEGRLTISAAPSKQVTSFALVGETDYTPAQLAADSVRKRHLPELTKIPRVHGVYLDQADGKILIDVQIEQNADGSKTPDDIKEVRRQVPDEIEGYRVEVTEFIPVVYAL